MKWQKIFRRGLTAFLIAIFLLSAALVGAAVEIFDGAGQYIMSDFENHDIAKQRAQQRAERDAQKKAGVALKTFSRSINSELTDDEISAVTNNIIQVSDVEIVPVPFETNGEAGIMYRATLKATIDTDGIYAWIKRDDKEKVTILNQNNSLQDAIAKNDKQVEDLKEKYNRATSQAEKDKLRENMKFIDRDFLASQKYLEGVKLYYAKDYNGAIKLYNEALTFGTYSEVYNNRGVAYYDLGEKERAIQDYDKSIELNPNSEYAYNNRGNVYSYLGKYEQAIVDYNKALEVNPNYYESYYNRGLAYYNLKQYERAIKDFDKTIKLNPNLAYAYNNRGNSYYKLGEYEQAIQDFNKAININPNDENSYIVRGLIYIKLEKYDSSIRDLGKAIELNPNNFLGYFSISIAYLMKENLYKAIVNIDEAIKLAPNNPQCYQLRGSYYQALGFNTKAQADFAKAKELGYKE